MTVLVAGASGATGRHLVQQLLDRGHDVRVIVRSKAGLPAALHDHPRLAITEAGVLDLNEAELSRLVHGCTAVASCLGHTLSFKGIYGQPRWLVTDATRRLCAAIRADKPATPVRFVLMNSSGNSNRDLHEPISLAQKCVIGLLRLLLPPHVDNEQAADFLRTTVGQTDALIQWAAVRPDSLITEDHVTGYKAFPSPIRSAIFNAGTVSRINVAHFMAELMTNDTLWNRWKGQMPVLYGEELSG